MRYRAADVYQTVETTEIGASMEATGGGDVAHVSDGDCTSAEGERRSQGHRHRRWRRGRA
jgi:hypothetical protein